MGSTDSWITSLSCSSSILHPHQHEVGAWLKFIFLSPCPQRALFSTVDGVFLLLLFTFFVQRFVSRYLFHHGKTSEAAKHDANRRSRGAHVHMNLWSKLSFTVTSLLTVLHIVASVIVLTRNNPMPWKLVDGIFWVIQAVTYVVILVLIAHEKRFQAAKHPLSLRIYWVVSFLVYTLFMVSGLIRLISDKDVGANNLMLEDTITIVSFALSIVSLVISIRGSSGIVVSRPYVSLLDDDNEAKIREPLLDKSNVSGYASASLVSKAFWIWMNPLLSKGYKEPLKLDDVPTLSPQHHAARMSKIFEMNWPKPEERSKHPVRTTLLRCFWKDLAFTAVLAIIRLLVMYAGPILIQGFIRFTAGEGSSPYEGYYLVLILLIAKAVECLTSHQFNFSSQKLGMLIRSTLITSLYKKGLQLTCSARQDHGIGQIVNYMAVDAQQLSDMILQLHAVWLMPIQLVFALGLLYKYLGASVLTALVGIIVILVFTIICTKKNNFYQFNVMRSRDSRMKATNEMLNYMRVIKLQAWEEHFSNQIQDFREAEYGWIWKFLFTISTTVVVMWSTPLLLSSLTFGTAIILGVKLDAATVFTSTTIFKILQEPIRTFPQSMISLSQAMISLGRLDKFMMSRELGDDLVERPVECDDGVAVKVSDGDFSWDDEGGDALLKDINFEIKKGELAAVVGTVGSGKSSLLAAVLGEMHKLKGKVRVCGNTAYVAQTSWIQNGTIQENILFGLPMNRERYKEVVRVCSLKKDFEIMEFGDQTEIGERGINLSGGQKQRIQLARAIYQDCDIYLLDDIFSAVDAHTGSEIFKECVRGALRDKTVVLVTHQVDFLHNVDLIMVMREGKVVQSGKYEEILRNGVDFKALVTAHESSMELVESRGTVAPQDSLKLSEPPRQTLSKSNGESNGENTSLTRSKSSEKGDSKLVKDEERERGQVGLHVYKQYVTEAFGWWGVVAVVLLSLVWQGSLMGADYWLAYETSADNAASFNPTVFIRVYSIIAVVSLLLILVRIFVTTLMGLKTAQKLFSQILYSIIRAPMSFFDTTPSGRILSRASTDQTNVDLFVPFFMSVTVAMYITLLSIIIVTCQYAWPTLILLIPLGWLNFWYRGYYIATSRELTRLGSITKAPMIVHFSESISGVMTIRCFKKQENFCQENIDRVNANLCMDFHNYGSNEWLGFRLELIGACILCASTLFMILLPSSIIKPENVGMSLSYGLSLNGVLFWAIYMSCFVENKMVSVERIKQFSNIPSEAEWRSKDHPLPRNWPSRGNVVIRDIQVRYRPNTPLVLKGLTLSIKGGEKVGVVGRTGSGKSTIIQVLFRLVEPTAGKIIIDQLDIAMLGLHDLRSRFGIIPQEPVLFKGTVRSNIDPLHQYSDDEIWKSLERCQLKDVVASKQGKLDSPVVDDGDNWSVGQRQLLCLGRVMLKKSRLLFMDEATASVDSQTDAVIQKIIREDFASCTIISIAHRIPTVMDCDRVLVVDAGRAKEFDRPSRLIEQPSLFGALVQEYANRSAGL